MSNEAERFVELYEPVAPSIYAWARLRIREPLQRRLDPEDLLQEICCRAFRRFDTFSPTTSNERAAFRSWMFGIAHNVLKEALRGVRTRGESVFGRISGSTTIGLDAVAAKATGVSTRVARRADLAEFLAGLSGIDDQDRRILVHHGLEERTHEETATLLGISRDQAEKRWQRLRARLVERGIPPGLAL
ncbi:MAG: sigma-70 family RNA polymerase sigma factor [Planctomycetes bacterium]|nr:sigma-70 family RNA polymerase sigma factor [Planctomycetota bacterium]